jgi:radical SAM protein with 4Fe4S-binding SPASM domain
MLHIFQKFPPDLRIRKYLSVKYLSAGITRRLDFLRLLLNRASGRVVFLPTAFVSVTGRCNSRCAACGIWKGPDDELKPADIEESVASLMRLGLKNLVITGGEPLMHADLFDIAGRLSGRGLRLFLCTNGMLLRRRREEVLKHFHSVVVSLDSHEPSSYEAIRGVDAFDEVVSGITSIMEGGMRVSIAHTLQKGNILHLAEFIGFTKGLGVDSVSVRPLDAYSLGFGTEYGQLSVRSDLLPSEDDMAGFPKALAQVQGEFSAELASGFITPDIRGLARMRDYFLAKTDDSFPKTRCNAPFSSCVIESNGDVKPCFFSEPFANVHGMPVADVKRFLNSDRARGTREGLKGQSGICRRCAYPYIGL